MAALALLTLVPAAAASDVIVNTGGEKGAYHGTFCPVLTAKLTEAGYPARCKVSNGTPENMARVAAAPTEIAYGQLDVLALDARQHGGESAFRKLRTDDVRECLFAVTRNPKLTNFGEVAVGAGELRFILPPETSGSAATFRFLRKLDPYALGQARDILHAADVDEALAITLADTEAVAIFVQFPDPDNARFKLIAEKGGHIIPVLDRNILSQRHAGHVIYSAQETQVSNARWLNGGTKVVTACTPLVVFTGAAARITDAAQRKRQDAIAAIIAGLRSEDLLPATSFVSRMLKRTRELTAVSAERFVRFSEEARDRASPLIERAREAARRAVEPAKPAEGMVPPEAQK
ncbi:MAG: hypothetical protein NW205_01345 [Hyphomicrobiaceae bacterium]|nr:hypothetical protein [Hyphomicrobiaceae bacterium]